MAFSIAKRASSFRQAGGSVRSLKKRRSRRAVSFTRDVFLLSAIRDESLDEINRVLEEMDADQELDLNAVLVGGRSALHQAVLAERSDAIDMLLDRGAYVDVLDDNGWTPLHYAVDAGHCDSASLLVTRGADPRHPTLDGNSCLPMDIAIDQCDSEMMALLSDGISRAQHRPLLIVSEVRTIETSARLVARSSMGFDDEITNDTMDYESTLSDFDNRSITSGNSVALFVPSYKRQAPGAAGPLRSLRRFRDKHRRPSPSPTPVKDSDIDTPEDGSYCTVNEFITDIFSNALRNAHCDSSASLSSATTADDSQDSLASFPNSSDSPRSSFLEEGTDSSICPGQTSSPAADSKTSSSSVLSEDSFHSPLASLSSMKKLDATSHYNSSGSLVSTDQPAVATSSSSPNSSSLQICSSGSSCRSRSAPRCMPARANSNTEYATRTPEHPTCVSPSYDVPRSGLPRKYLCDLKCDSSLGQEQLSSSFQYDVPHSAARRPVQTSTLTAQEPLRYAHGVMDESTLIGEDESGVLEAEDHSQITPQASLSCASPDLQLSEDRVTPDVIALAPAVKTSVDSSADLRSELIARNRHLSCPAASRSGTDFDASDSTIGVRSNNSESRLSPEFELTRSYQIKDTYTSVQSLPTYRHATPDDCCSPPEPRSPLTPESSTGSEDTSSSMSCTSPATADKDYVVSATLPWRGRHGGIRERPALPGVTIRTRVPPKDAKGRSNRLSAAEFLLSLSPSGPPAVVEECEEENDGDGDVLSLLDFLGSSDHPTTSTRSPSPVSDTLELSASDFLLSLQAFPSDVDNSGVVPELPAPPAAVKPRRPSGSDDQPRPDRPVSLVSDWMAPVGSNNLSSHVATLPRAMPRAMPAASGVGLQRNTAARGSFRRLISKATRSSKKSALSTSSDGPNPAAPELQTGGDNRQDSVGSDEAIATNDASTSRKTFLQRTATLRHSFRSRKARKAKGSSVGSEEDGGGEVKKLDARKPAAALQDGDSMLPPLSMLVTRRDRVVDEPIMAGNLAAPTADKRAPPPLTVSVTAL